MKSQIFILALLCLLVNHCLGQQEKTERRISFSAVVVNELNVPVSMTTVSIKNSHTRVATDDEGRFTLMIAAGDVLELSAVGYENLIYKTGKSDHAVIVMKQKITELDEAVVIAYGKSSRRLNTGSVSKLSAKEISLQPVNNPLAALQGRVPGLTVTANSGVTGAPMKVQLRGQGSIALGTEPLYVIDGVPVASGNSSLSNLSNASAGWNPFMSVNPSDIESIEVLKDADATAIYGSRGANGVILISTKKGSKESSRLDVQLQTGVSSVIQKPAMMNTRQYLQMRREAFANDGAVADMWNAPDMLVWDSSRYTDFPDLIMGGSSSFTDAQLSFRGGSAKTGFVIGGGYRKEGSLFAGSRHYQRGSLHTSLHHQSKNGKLDIQLTAQYSADKNLSLGSDLSSEIVQAPDFPALYDSTGALRWEEQGMSFTNPFAALKRGYRSKTEFLLGNVQIGYQLLKGLELKLSAGYNQQHTDEWSRFPSASFNPAWGLNGFAYFGKHTMSSKLIEPQLVYKQVLYGGKLEVLAGGSMQENSDDAYTLRGMGYTSDQLLEYIGGASSLQVLNSYQTKYKYAALFGRIHYNYKDRYLLNISGRRDGSSRFGPGKQFGNFGAAGAAWIFSNEERIAKAMPWLSFGKLRMSYGVTGNDQLPDYLYLNTWQVGSYSYQGNVSYYPGRLYNPSLAWEVNRKLEAAIELGVLKGRIFLSAAYYRNRSGNQLVSYILPTQTGASSVQKNLDALVQNSGAEFVLQGKIIDADALKWTAALNMTIPKNKLLRFPGLEQSSYAGRYIIGQSLSVLNVYHTTGVDPAMGVFRFEDVDKNGIIEPIKDYRIAGDLAPKYYGGLSSSISYKKFQLDFLFEFKKQQGMNYLYAVSQLPAGSMVNQPVALLNNWKQPGDHAGIQKFTQDYFSDAYQAWSQYRMSDGVYGDASYVRLRNISISYTIDGERIAKKGIGAVRIYLQGQNLVTISSYEAGDPETQNIYAMPLLKTMAAGVQITLN